MAEDVGTFGYDLRVTSALAHQVFYHAQGQDSVRRRQISRRIVERIGGGDAPTDEPTVIARLLGRSESEASPNFVHSVEERLQLDTVTSQLDDDPPLSLKWLAAQATTERSEVCDMSRADQVRGKLLLTLAVSGLLVVACTRDTSSTRSATRDVRVETAETRVTPESPPIVDPSITPVRSPLRSIAAEPVLALGLGDVFSPSFTPAGDAVLFHAGREHSPLMRATFDRTGRPALATVLRDGASNYHVTASPDGQWLAFDSDRDGIRGVYVAHADASDPRKVSGEDYAAVPRWSPDGRQIAFVKAEATRPRVWNVWIADLATGTLSRVSHHRVGQAWAASWFPNGKRLAYSVEDTLVIASLDGGDTRVLPSPRRRQLVRTPAVSPSGKQVVFQVYRDGVWVLDVGSGRMDRLLADAAAEEFAWSPDGRRIVFHTRRNGVWSVWQLRLEPNEAS